ncbi:MAG: hypothetical protein MPI95_05010 [Nitrosopumilus sp.]|nr:hypothetical protein [Nitrosopumilus sp.]MDA7942919.1 hypothetical protein [Nitrosopumilus sp.]MDA7958434.1 hypothetical protein [Nitrosopumilus sp.]MDA7998416.1 hypothetical protein [Nitrosopumilus sp.]
MTGLFSRRGRGGDAAADAADHAGDHAGGHAGDQAADQAGDHGADGSDALREELDGLRQKIEMVKEEYRETVATLMATKRELNQKRLELDATTLSIARAGQRAREDPKAPSTSRADMEAAEEGMKKIRMERAKCERDLAAERSELAALTSRRARMEEGIKEAEGRARAAADAAAPEAPARGVVEAASALAASLRSDLARAREELEKERASHEETRRKLSR